MATTRQPHRRPGRPAGAPRLDEERIVTAALALVDGEGLAALSMRRLAQELGVDPMSIYHHVPGKAALVSALVRRVFAAMPQPESPDAAWPARVRAWAHGYHDLTRAHPHLVLQIVTDAAAVAEAAELVDVPLRDALREAGLTRQHVTTATGLVVDYVNGFALAGTAGSTRGLDRGLDLVLLGVQALAEQRHR